MITTEERIKLFKEEMDKLEKRFEVQLIAVIQRYESGEQAAIMCKDLKTEPKELITPPALDKN